MIKMKMWKEFLNNKKNKKLNRLNRLRNCKISKKYYNDYDNNFKPLEI